jgi:hypothetical protein
MIESASEWSQLPRLRRTGEEPFRLGGRNLDFNLLTFWQWIASDLVSNTMRGVLAEFLIAKALGIGTDGIRDEWGACDLEHPSGIKIQVKSSAYVQSWAQKGPSFITFPVRKTRAWDSATGLEDPEPRRHADAYVFALLAHRDKATVDPFQLSQWRFYVLPTSVLNARTRSQHSITLRSLEALTPPVAFEDLQSEVSRAAQMNAEGTVVMTRTVEANADQLAKSVQRSDS